MFAVVEMNQLISMPHGFSSSLVQEINTTHNIFSFLRSSLSVSACLTVTAMTFDARWSGDGWSKGFEDFILGGKVWTSKIRKNHHDLWKLDDKTIFSRHRYINPRKSVSDCSHPWHLIWKRSFLLSCSLVQKLNSCITLLIVDYLTSLPFLSCLPALFPFRSDLFRFVRSCSRLLFLSSRSLVLQFDFTLSWIKNMIASIAIRSRFIGFMLALIVFYGLFRN